MRIVGIGHQVQPHTGSCRRCGCALNSPAMLTACKKAPPHKLAKAKERRLPNLYANSKQQDSLGEQ